MGKESLQDARPEEKALKEAAQAWEGNEFTRGERQDLYYQLCFRHQDPIDSAVPADRRGDFWPYAETPQGE